MRTKAITFIRIRLHLWLVILIVLAGFRWPDAVLAEEEKKGIGVEEAIASLPSGLKTPNRFAVVVGAGQYADERIPKLPACVNDAKALYETLTDPAIGMFSKENVTLLTDQQVTKENVIDALDQLGRHAGPQDLVVVFFSGHGATDERGRAYWVMNNTQIDKLRATALAESDITELLGEVKTTRLVALIDACYSAATANLQQTKSLLDLATIFPKFQGEGRVAITASKGDQLSVVIKDKNDPGFGFSVFTWQVIQGLRGQADTDNDGVVTVDKLWNYVKDRTEQIARQQGGEQYPQLKGQLGSKFMLAVNSSLLVSKAQATMRRLGTLRSLFLDKQVSAAQFEQGRKLLEVAESDLDETDRQRRKVFADLVDGQLRPEYLEGALTKVESPEQIRTRERAKQVAEFLSIAHANDSVEQSSVALWALDQLLQLDPNNEEAKGLRSKIAGYVAATPPRLVSTSGATVKIVSVDLNRIFNEYYKTPIASAKLKETADQFNRVHDQMMADYKRTGQGQKEIDEYRTSHRKILEDQTKSMRETILKEINQVIQYEARKAGYTYIFDKSGNTLNGVPGLVFSEDSTDISDQIIKILNKSKP